MRNAEAIEQLVSDIEQKYGSVLVLVNNRVLRVITCYTHVRRWLDDILNIHLKAVYRLSKRVLKVWLVHVSVALLTSSSVVAHFANPRSSKLFCCKAGIEAFSRSLAKMGSRQITVNVFASFIATEMTDQLSEEIRKKAVTSCTWSSKASLKTSQMRSASLRWQNPVTLQLCITCKWWVVYGLILSY